jgi:hypothetical protein
MAKLLYMRLILRFRTIPLPLGCWRCVDLHGGLIGGDVDVLVLDHDALLAGRPVALQRLELSGVGPQQLHRQTARVVELEAVTGRPDLAQQFHGRPVNPDHLGAASIASASSLGPMPVTAARAAFRFCSEIGWPDGCRWVAFRIWFSKRSARSTLVVPIAFIIRTAATLGWTWVWSN